MEERGTKMKVKVNPTEKQLIEFELRRGTSKSRIAHLLHVDFDTACRKIQLVKEALRPEIGDTVGFTFRDVKMIGSIRKLLTNSAVVDINWEISDPTMKDICTNRTIVNFKDIEFYVQRHHLLKEKEAKVTI